MMKTKHKMIVMLFLLLTLCSADTTLKVTWKKYDILNNPDVARLSFWEINPATLQWVRTINDFINPLDSSFTFIVPSAEARGTRYYIMVAVDSAENRSDPSNVASFKFKLDKIENLAVTLK